MAKKKVVKKVKAKVVGPKRPRGRPHKYTEAQAEKRISDYFSDCDKNKIPYTMTGLTMALGITKQTLSRWCDEEHYLSDLVRAAKLVVEHRVEILLLTQANTAGSIFWLKNQGWTDKSETVVKGEFRFDHYIGQSRIGE